MKLSFKQILDFTVGAISAEEKHNGIHFQRYTDKQLEAFNKEARCFFKRAAYTSGIRIDFYTDSRSLEVSVGAEGKYEILIDGLTAYCQQFTCPDMISLSLEMGMKRITIVLPSHTPGVIHSIELDDSATIAAVEYPMNIIFYGDSITQGWDSEKDTQSFAWLVTRYFDANSMILGVGGANFFPDTVVDNGFDPDVVIAALGTNDYAGDFTIDEIRSNCAAYLDRLYDLYAGKKLFFITPIWRADGNNVVKAGTLPEIRTMLAEEAVKRNMFVIDGYTLVPHRTEYFADGFLHPNDIGFALYAQNLIKAMQPHI